MDFYYRLLLPYNLDILLSTYAERSKPYQFEFKRLESFKEWRSTHVTPAKLAAAGFYYTGRDCLVKCFECKLHMNKWHQYGNLMEIHRQRSNNCRFIRNIPCGNVPISDRHQDVPSEGHDEYGAYEDKNFTNYMELKRELFESKYGVKDLDRINPHICAIYPEFMTYDKRLSTYHACPKISSMISKDNFASAGLFYSGKDDEVVCYHCGGKLRDWKPEDDDPWKKHEERYKYCSHLFMLKGKKYLIRNIHELEEKMMKSLTVIEDMRSNAESNGTVEGAYVNDNNYVSVINEVRFSVTRIRYMFKMYKSALGAGQ